MKFGTYIFLGYRYLFHGAENGQFWLSTRKLHVFSATRHGLDICQKISQENRFDKREDVFLCDSIPRTNICYKEIREFQEKAIVVLLEYYNQPFWGKQNPGLCSNGKK